MPLLHIVILALVQGISEFLPISSSGHLILAHEALGHQGAEMNLILDIAVHVGTLFAVLLYFRKDVMAMLCGCVCTVQGKGAGHRGRKLLIYVLAASLPVIIAGFVLHSVMPDMWRSVTVTAWCTLIFGIVLWIADKKGLQTRTVEDITLKDALLVGCAQVLALIPGVSRSGITMTAARFLGVSRTESARFSMLLAMVAISGAGVLGGLSLLESGDMALGFDVLFAVAFSFVSALAALHLMMKWLEKASFTPFVIYRIALGLLLLGLIYGGVIAS